ncbi:MAG: helix-turn-helix domain-containing protein [Actinomycetota bacterium]|nr:helix-turn-helix domain-containing protein [Actinomycetota bacterium]
MAGTFRERLRELRDRAGMTQEDLAHHSGISVRTIRRFERDERTNPQTATVKRLAEALALSADEQRDLFALASGRESEDPADDAPVAARRPRRPDHLALAAAELAMGVRIRLRHAYEHQQVHDPYPLPVRWTQVSRELSDHEDNILDLPTGGRANQVALAGEFKQIAAFYRRLPSGRLVVLGDAGSGKTMLAIRLTLDLLENRERSQPVPVTVSIASWDPTRMQFRDWLSGLLIRDHPGLARTTSGGLTLSTALVKTDAILPVLDGFDELAPKLRGPALQALNRAQLPAVLTSRATEYENAVRTTDVLTAAAVVRLETLTATDVARYLTRATPEKADSETVWHPVIAKLTADNPDRAANNVTMALSTPLMVSLARTIYSDTPGREPADLLDTSRFPEAADIEEHLVSSYVPTKYLDQSPPGAHGRDQNWDPDKVLRWLGYLARHGSTRRESGIAWWAIGSAVPIWSRAIIVGLVSTFTIMLVAIVIGVPLFMVIQGEPFSRMLVNGLFDAAAGPLLGLAYGLLRRFRIATPAPLRVRVRIGQGRPPGAIPLIQVRTRVVSAFIGGLAVGASVGFLAALALRTPVPTAAAAGAAFGGVYAIAAAAAVGVVSWFESPADAESAVSPAASLKTNRTSVLTQLLLGGLVFGLVTGLGAYATEDIIFSVFHQLTDDTAALRNPGYRLGVGAMNGLLGAFTYALLLTSWGQWVILARLWLPLTGRLPWRLLTFMEDAYDRGVLRRSGPVWEFRHARLQRHLAGVEPRNPRPDQR